eukprot:2998569-Pyramimonas_sp.AAC.1
MSVGSGAWDFVAADSAAAPYLVNCISENGRISTLVHMRCTVGGAKTFCVTFFCVFSLAPMNAPLERSGE